MANYYGPPALTKIVATIGPNQSAKEISSFLVRGMSVARFDTSCGDSDYYNQTVTNLKDALDVTPRMCGIMVETSGPQISVKNASKASITLTEQGTVKIIPERAELVSSQYLPINFDGLSKEVKPRDTIVVVDRLCEKSASPSVWLEVSKAIGDSVLCVIKNTATLSGPLFTLHFSSSCIDRPILSNKDKEFISTFRSGIDFLSLSYTQSAENVHVARQYLSENDKSWTQIFAKIENVEGLTHFNDILSEADGIILCRESLGLEYLPEQVFEIERGVIRKCNISGKPVIVTNCVGSMVSNFCPTPAESCDVAHLVSTGIDAILLGVETLFGEYAMETITTVAKICFNAEQFFDRKLFLKNIGNYQMSDLEILADEMAEDSINGSTPYIICMTRSGIPAKIIAKWRPKVPVLAIDFPPSDQYQPSQEDIVRWKLQMQRSILVRGFYPVICPEDICYRDRSQVRSIAEKFLASIGYQFGDGETFVLLTEK